MVLRDIWNDLSEYSTKWEHYFPIYERHLSRFRGKKFTMVEIGVLGGGSLEMWKKYFGDQVSIIGIDIDRRFQKYVSDQVRIEIGDQGSLDFWDEFYKKYGKVDVVLDDGGHTMWQQRATLYKSFPNINPGGVFICEDLHTSYWESHGGKLLDKSSFIEYSKEIVDVLNLSHHRQELPNDGLLQFKEAESLHFYDSMVVIEKKTPLTIQAKPCEIGVMK